MHVHALKLSTQAGERVDVNDMRLCFSHQQQHMQITQWASFTKLVRSVRVHRDSMHKYPHALMYHDVCHDEHGSIMNRHATCDWSCQYGQRAGTAGEHHLLSLQG